VEMIAAVLLAGVGWCRGILTAIFRFPLPLFATLYKYASVTINSRTVPVPTVGTNDRTIERRTALGEVLQPGPLPAFGVPKSACVPPRVGIWMIDCTMACPAHRRVFSALCGVLTMHDAPCLVCLSVTLLVLGLPASASDGLRGV